MVREIAEEKVETVFLYHFRVCIVFHIV